MVAPLPLTHGNKARLIHFVRVYSQTTMNAFSNRQEGGAIGMIGVAATGTPDDRRHADRDTDQSDPGGK